MDPSTSAESQSQVEIPVVVQEEEDLRWDFIPAATGEEKKVVEWDDLQEELGRLWSFSQELSSARDRKAALATRLESVLEVRRKSIEQSNELEEMKQKLETCSDFMTDLQAHTKRLSEEVKDQREQLCLKIRTCQVAGKTLYLARNQLQEANKLLSGENGSGRLKNLQKMLRIRQQFMVAQVANLYPVKAVNEKAHINSDGTKSRDAGSTSPNVSQNGPSSLEILGLQLTKLPVKKTSYFSDKKEVQKSATVLGYVAHAVYLIASYLDVPLRYPLRFGGSRSYVLDPAPSFESSSADMALNPILASASTSTRLTEFPLFFEGQDATRAAYAIFLLNKDLEQLLNFIGADSLGPRRVLDNLKRLTRIIKSQEYVVVD